MSIRNHEMWPEIAQHVKIEKYAPDGGYRNPRFRLEFDREVSEQQKQAWIKITSPCVACGNPIHPIRERKPGGRAPLIGHIYIAPCCPLGISIGCSRGTAAHDEYLAIRKSVEELKMPHGQLLL